MLALITDGFVRSGVILLILYCDLFVKPPRGHIRILLFMGAVRLH